MWRGGSEGGGQSRLSNFGSIGARRHHAAMGGARGGTIGRRMLKGASLICIRGAVTANTFFFFFLCVLSPVFGPFLHSLTLHATLPPCSRLKGFEHLPLLQLFVRPPPLLRPSQAAYLLRGGTGTLVDLLSMTRPCLLRPLAFVVAWSGVLALVYDGWPAPILELKSGLANLPSLPVEASGSKFPKTSVGALRDGLKLSPTDLAKLEAICGEESSSWAPLPIGSLSLVLFRCRCLEKVLFRQEVVLRGSLIDAHPSIAEKNAAEAVVSETREPDYFRHASRDGGRESHYRGPAGGATLVTFLGGKGPLAHIQRFCARVEEALPGMYNFFDPSSLHVTIRAIL